MPETEPHALHEACPNCATLLDISEEQPLARVTCPICGTAMRVRRQIKSFRVLDVVGAGGMGTVYKATDLNLNRQVALKVLRKEFSDQPEYTAKLELEAKITAAINNPHVVKVFSCGEDHGQFFLAMELVEKGSLDDLMQLQKTVPEIQALEVGIQVAHGLKAAWERGLIHRDVKPGNILFAEAHTAKIVDFGLALLMEKQAEARGEVWGTPFYVAPEKLDYQPEDFRSDIYSLGATLFHALCGRPPFDAKTASMVALKHLKSQAVSLQAFAPDVSSGTAVVINRMLHKDPNERYGSYDELIEHLEYARSKLIETTGDPRKTSSRLDMEGAGTRKTPGWLTLGLLAALLLAVASGIVFRDRIKAYFGSQPADEPAIIAPNRAAALAQYETARQLLVGGDAAAAFAAFDKLSREPELAQPLKNWVLTHLALSAMLDEKPPEGRDIFKKLHEAKLYSEAPSEVKLANFFVESGRLMSSPDAIPATIVRTYDAQSVDAFAILLFALKDWNLGAFGESDTLFQTFLKANPPNPHAWIAQYKPIARRYAEEYGAYSSLADQLKGTTTVAAGRELLQRTTQGASKLKASDPLKAHYEKLGRDIEATIAGIEQKAREEEERRLSALRDSEPRARADLLGRCNVLFAEYKFDEAAALVNSARFELPGSQTSQRGLSRKAGWLSEFKKTLTRDINTAGYAGGVITRTGVPIAGKVAAADAEGMKVTTPYGPIPTRWQDLHPETLVTMSYAFLEKSGTPAASALRLWHVGVYCMEFNMEQRGRQALTEAARMRPEFNADLSLFFDVASPPD